MILIKALLTTAVVAVTVLPAPAAFAAAAEDLRVTWEAGAGTVGPQGGVPGLLVANRGTTAATGVTATIDLTGVDERVTAAIAGENSICELAARKVTCDVGTLAAESGRQLIAITLTTAPGAAPGAAGEMVATLASEQNPGGVTARTPVQIITGDEPQPNSIALIADLNTPARRAGPGDRLPVYAAIRNDGDAPLTDYRVSIALPMGATIVERYRDCAYSGRFPGYPPSQVECHLSRPLQPGQILPLFDPVTKKPLFRAAVLSNLPGPDDNKATFTAVPEADPHRPDNGTGPSFAAAVAALPLLGTAPPSLHGDQGITQFSLFSKPNRFDIALSRPEYFPAGEQVTAVQFTLLNNGPSDSGALVYEATAPKGAVFLPPDTDNCYTKDTPGSLQPESKVLVCQTFSPFPTVRSKITPQVRALQLRVKSTPTGKGKITVRGTEVGSTETNWKNNTLVIDLPVPPSSSPTPTPGGGQGGGDGGSLPITGAPAALTAATGALLVALGAVFAFGRRRRQRA
ncbi:hypothetical protein ACQPZJ_19110 [Actinoplanes sp. CA-054009]